MMNIIVAPGGILRMLYGEEIDLTTLGPLHIRRASYVEADEGGHWWADLSLSNGPLLGAFVSRTAALAAEASWLEANRVALSP